MRAKNSQRGCAKNRVKVPFFTNQKKLVKTRWNILHDKLSEKFTFCCQLLWGNFSNGSKSTIVCSVRYQNFFVNMILNDDTQNFLVGLWVFDLSGSLEWLRGGFLSPVWKKMDDKKVAWKGLLCGFSAGPPPGLLLKKSTERARVASKIVFIFSIGHSTRLSIITGR